MEYSILIRWLVSIECTKDGVSFKCNGDIGNGSVTLRSHTNVDKPEMNVEINLTEPVALTFSLKYLMNFCKASGLSGQVKLCLSNEVPLLVEYGLSNNSYLRFYLAPKVRMTRQLIRLPPANPAYRLATRNKQIMLRGSTQPLHDRSLTSATMFATGIQSPKPAAETIDARTHV